MGSYYSATRGRLSDASLRFETDANHAGLWKGDAGMKTGVAFSGWTFRTASRIRFPHVSPIQC
jgi:hypothetical protein